MKKVLAALGAALLLGCAFLGWALASAAERLRRTELETAEDIERLRARPLPPVLDEFLIPKRRPPRNYERGMREVGPRVEMHDQDSLLQASEDERKARRPAISLQYVLRVVALYADAARDTEAYGIQGLPRLHRPFRYWQAALLDPDLGAAELREAARSLEELERTLPTAFDAFRLQHLLERIDVVAAARNGAENWASAHSPRLSHLRSRDILYCSILSELERQHAELMDLERRTPPERLKAALALAEGTPAIEGRLWLGGAEAMFLLELARLQVSIMRVGASLRAVELETGRPAELTERHFCPFTGAPYRYENGKLWAPGPDFDDDGGRAPIDEGNDEADGDVVLTLRKP